MPISRKNNIKKKRNLSKKTKLQMRGGMKINVKRLDGSILTVDVNRTDTFYTLKEKIMSISGIPIDRQRLIFATYYQVQDEQTLADYGIHEGNTINLIIKSQHNSSQPPELILSKRKSKVIT